MLWKRGGRPWGPQLTATAPKICRPKLHGWHITHSCCRQLTVPPNLSLSIAPVLLPTNAALVGSYSRESSWQADGAGGFRGAASLSLGAAARPQPNTSLKNQWAFLASSACPPPGPGSLLFLLPTRANGKRSQGSFLWAVSCKIEANRRRIWPQTGTWWWDAEGILLCAIAL